MRALVLRAGIGILSAGALALAAGAGPGLCPQKRGARAPEVPLQPFEGRLEEARELARARNVPLVEVWVFETEPWDPKVHHDIEGLRATLTADADLARRLERAVVVLACNRVHPSEEVEEGSGDARATRVRCSAYHTTGCTPHQRLFEEIFGGHNVDGVLRSPFVRVTRPDGEENARWDDGSTPSKDALLKGFELAAAAAGAGMTSAEHLEVRQLAASAEAAALAGRAGEAWRDWNALVAINADAPLGKRGLEQRTAALAVLEQRRTAARSALAAGQGVAAWELLHALAASSRGTPLERDVARELKKLESSKEHRAEIARRKQELAAEALVNEIDALLRAGDERGAKKRLQRLFKRYGETSAAATARERWPQHVPA